jgi:hypothetical protein
MTLRNFSNAKTNAPNNMDKRLVGLGMIVGSTLGAYIPVWLGASTLSYQSVIGALIGGICGIWAVVKLLGQ